MYLWGGTYAKCDQLDIWELNYSSPTSQAYDLISSLRLFFFQHPNSKSIYRLLEIHKVGARQVLGLETARKLKALGSGSKVEGL